MSIKCFKSKSVQLNGTHLEAETLYLYICLSPITSIGSIICKQFIKANIKT